ncbi:hypothetical protein D9M70_508110 [compost metagenome]
MRPPSRIRLEPGPGRQPDSVAVEIGTPEHPRARIVESDHDPVAAVVNAMNAVGMAVPLETRILHHENAVMLVMEPVRMANEAAFEPIGMKLGATMMFHEAMAVALAVPLEVTAAGQRHGAAAVIAGPGSLGRHLAPAEAGENHY